MKVKVSSLIIISLLFSVGAILFAQDSAFEEDGWKKRFASPSYGISLLILEVQADGVEETIVVPGFDFRIFNGMNISKRGGFYTGYEVGAVVYGMGESDSFFVPDAGAGENLHVAEVMCGSIFIMQKYGYRVDLGVSAGGVSLGAEVGIGIQAAGGTIEIDDDDPATDSVSADTDDPFGMLLEITAEGTLRMGQNTRLFAGLGLMVSNPMFDDLDGTFGSPTLDIEQVPVRPVLRGGFSMSY